MVGLSSCASATCHGGIASNEATWRTSFSVWESRDPHSGAGLILANEQSRAIIALLEPPAAISQDAMLDALKRRCTSCHVTSESSPATFASGTEQTSHAQKASLSLVSGVSCESCHGAASEWLDRHTRADWNQDATRFSVAVGMLDTEDLLPRIDVCVRCHLGSRTADGLVRDMNHDLIAAGHPALNFDMAEFMHRLPPHWDSEAFAKRESGVTAVQRNSAARWRVMAGQARLTLQRLEAHSQHPAIPFPELSEYDCISCHHELVSAALNPAHYVSTWGWNRTLLQGLVEGEQLKSLDLTSLLKATDMQVVRDQLGRNVAEWQDKSAAILGVKSSSTSPRESVPEINHE